MKQIPNDKNSVQTRYLSYVISLSKNSAIIK